ncbi:MAG TPA: GNAT family N-acetyltransferase [Acidimicrobiales bacterium]|nr:GNAT family N-acetyltransferase [Acidimicrobiales bacterium]
MHLLDNPVWHALTGPQQKVAEGTSRAARYQPGVAPFSALPDEPDGASWDDLRALLGRGDIAVLFGEPRDTPADWDELFRLPTLQMIATHVEPAVAPNVVSLATDDVDDMLALVGRTHPGPFERRTIELGDYLGVRDDHGVLVAMAGMRMRAPGHTEISAVCTDSHLRGRGIASALVRDLVGRILDRGDTPLLHVLETNVSAIRVYEALGFTARRGNVVVGFRPPP